MPINDVARGNNQYIFIVSPSLTPAALVASTTTVFSATVPGIQPTDVIGAVNSAAAQTAGVGIANARVTAANTVAITFSNSTTGTPTPVAGVYNIVVFRPSQQPLPTTAQ